LTTVLNEFGDYPMMRRMLLGIRDRAETTPPARDRVIKRRRRLRRTPGMSGASGSPTSRKPGRDRSKAEHD
jgi:hypothetical protein